MSSTMAELVLFLGHRKKPLVNIEIVVFEALLLMLKS